MINNLRIKKFTPELIDSIDNEKYKKVYLEWLLNNEEEYLYDNLLKNAIFKNINTPVEFLLNYYDKGNNTEILTESIASKIILLNDTEYLKELFLKYENINFIIEAISKNKNINDEIIDLIFKNYTNLIINLINNDKISLDEIIKINSKASYGLKDDTFNYLSSYVSKIVSPVELEKLMNYTSKDLNYFISQNKNLTKELFHLLSLSNDFRTRSILAQRTDTPLDILFSFLDDESDTVRLALSKNININEEILLSLAIDSKVTIIKEVIKHRNTNKFILESIINSEKIADNIKKPARKQLLRLKNLYIENNSDYFDIIESLKQGKVENIIITEKLNLKEDRKKIIIDLKE